MKLVMKQLQNLSQKLRLYFAFHYSILRHVCAMALHIPIFILTFQDMNVYAATIIDCTMVIGPEKGAPMSQSNRNKFTVH